MVQRACDFFTVVYWDQRGCGRSAGAARYLSLQAMIGDTEELLGLLAERFGRPVVLAGFSMGATIAARAAARRPDLVATLVAVSMDLDGAAAGTNAYEFALASARARPNRRAVRQLKAIGPALHPEPRGFATRVRWAADFGGVRTGYTYGSMARGLVASLLRSPDYSPAGAVRALRGITAAQAALLPALEAIDLARTVPSLDCPVVMVQGRHDQVAPGAAAERYAARLTAPSKQLTWFEDSAHLPHLEEPGRFREVLAKVRANLGGEGRRETGTFVPKAFITNGPRRVPPPQPAAVVAYPGKGLNGPLLGRSGSWAPTSSRPCSRWLTCRPPTWPGPAGCRWPSTRRSPPRPGSSSTTPRGSSTSRAGWPATAS